MADKWNKNLPVLKLDDLAGRDDSLPVKLSILMSINDFRKGQLARSLECLCRQDWKEFEILVCDNGSPNNLQEVFDIFEAFLRLRTVRLERSRYSACPSIGIRALMPYTRGEIIAIMQPEIMLNPRAAWFLYDAHFSEWPNVHKYKISTSNFSMRGAEKWSVIKPAFFHADSYKLLDKIDWHTDLSNIEGLPRFNTHSWGLGNTTNHDVRERREYPWWFVGSAKSDSLIWKELPLFYNHASIDQWLLSFRRIHQMVDLCPRATMGYHQWHHRGPQGAAPDEADVMPKIPTTRAERESWKPMDLEELSEVVTQYDFDPEGHSYESLVTNLTRLKVEDSKIRGLGADGRDGDLTVRETGDAAGGKSARIHRIHKANE